MSDAGICRPLTEIFRNVFLADDLVGRDLDSLRNLCDLARVIAATNG